MKIVFRVRRPSANQLLGVTQAKRRLLTETGYYHATRAARVVTNLHRQALRRVGYYSASATAGRVAGRAFRKLLRG